MPCSEWRGGRCWRAGLQAKAHRPGRRGDRTPPGRPPIPPRPLPALPSARCLSPRGPRTLRSTGQMRPLSQVVCFHFTGGKTEAHGD